MGDEQGNQDNQDEKNKQNNPENTNNPNNLNNPNNQDKTAKPENIIVCSTKVCEDITMAVPVEVRTHTDVGNVVLKCMESKVIKEQEKVKNVSKFEIVQKVFTQIPINFVTEVEVKNDRADFHVYECSK